MEWLCKYDGCDVCHVFFFFSKKKGNTRLYPFPGLLEHFYQPLLPTTFIRIMHIHPSRRQRQTHQNTLHPRARRVQPETRASVVDEVELDISAPSQLLPFLFAFRKRHVLSFCDEGEVGGQERRQAVFYEGEELFLFFFFFVEVVEEDASDAAGFASVGDVEVLVAPLLEARVVASVVLVACLFDCAVEVYSIFVEQIGWCKVRAAAKPPGVAIALCVHGFEVAVVEVHSWCVGVLRVQDATETCGEKFETFDVWIQGFVIHAHLLDGWPREGAVDGAYIDACFLKDGAILEDARYPSTTIRPRPGIRAEPFRRVQSLES